MNAGAREFVPAAHKDFPSLAGGPANLQRLASKALDAKRQVNNLKQQFAAAVASKEDCGNSKVVARGSVVLSRHIPVVPPAQLPSPHAPPAVIPPSVPLFQSSASEAAASKWKEKWMQAARVVFEKEQANRVSKAAIEAATAAAGKVEVTSSSWHVALAPCAATLLSNTGDWATTSPHPAAAACVAVTSPTKQPLSPPLSFETQTAAGAGEDRRWWEALVLNDVAAVAASPHESLAGLEGPCPLPEHEGLTALMLCARLGRGQILQMLLDPPQMSSPRPKALFISLDLRERRSKSTALLLAVEAGKVECARLLLRAGASLECKDRAAETVLHKAARSGSAAVAAWVCSLERSSRLLRINSKNKRGETPLLLCTSRDVASVFLDFGAATTATTVDGQTILSLAASVGNHRLLECALGRHGPAIEHKDKNGDSALVLAARSHHASGAIACVRALLSAECDVDALSNDGTSAIMVAAASGKAEVVRMLVQRGACLSFEDPFGANALALAVLGGHLEIAMDLLDAGAGLTCRALRRLLPPQARAVEALMEDPKAYFAREEREAPGEYRGVEGLGRGQGQEEEKWQSPLRLTFLGSPVPVAAAAAAPTAATASDGGLLAPPDLRIIMRGGRDDDDEGEGGGEGSGDEVLLTHQAVLAARCGRLEAMVRFQQRQGAGAGAGAVPAEGLQEEVVVFHGLGRVRRRSLGLLVRYLYIGDASVLLEKISLLVGQGLAREEEQLLDLLWLADEFLVPPLRAEMEAVLLRRLAEWRPTIHTQYPQNPQHFPKLSSGSPFAGVYLGAACALGLDTLRVASAFVVLRGGWSGGGDARGDREAARDALLSLNVMLG